MLTRVVEEVYGITDVTAFVQMADDALSATDLSYIYQLAERK